MDSVFAQELAKQISAKLYGDRAAPGLSDALRKCQNFEQYKEIVGKMAAFEEVLAMMDEIVKQLRA